MRHWSLVKVLKSNVWVFTFNLHFLFVYLLLCFACCWVRWGLIFLFRNCMCSMFAVLGIVITFVQITIAIIISIFITTTITTINIVTILMMIITIIHVIACTKNICLGMHCNYMGLILHSGPIPCIKAPQWYLCVEVVVPSWGEVVSRPTWYFDFCVDHLVVFFWTFVHFLV